jgi:hypothetical protein
MCLPTIWRAATRCAKRAFVLNSNDGANVSASARAETKRPAPVEPSSAARSSIEFWEPHRGFSIRVFSGKDGSFSIHVEGGRAADAAKIEKRFADAGDPGVQKFPSFARALQSVDAVKLAIDKFLAESGDRRFPLRSRSARSVRPQSRGSLIWSSKRFLWRDQLNQDTIRPNYCVCAETPLNLKRPEKRYPP